MEHQNDEVSTLSVRKLLTPKTKSKPESGIVNLIETVELLRRNKVLTDQSYSEAFFSSVKQYIVNPE